LAELLAGFHEQAPRAAPAAPFGTAHRRQAAALAALEGARPFTAPAELAGLGHWIEAESTALAPFWESRRAAGLIRECHGDLHLANVLASDAGVAAFDGIEFDPALRWIDVLDDIAFVVMDFTALGRRSLAFRFLNGWLDRTGDHACLRGLRFSMVYRALVRAQVEGLRNERAGVRRYVDTALAAIAPLPPRLFITHGLPGSGKTFRSQQLLEREGAIRLRSDVERKRLFGLRMLQDSRAAGVDLYSADATERTYAHLLETAGAALEAGWPVVLDAAFLRRAERDRARALATRMMVPFLILHCEAPMQSLRERLKARRGDASEADTAVLEKLLVLADPLSHDELGSVLPA
jgi:predicted kinase